MKYIGTCKEQHDFVNTMTPAPGIVMLFSEIPLVQYKGFHLVISRTIEKRNYLQIDYIDDEIYEKTLELSGGERNLP